MHSLLKIKALEYFEVLLSYKKWAVLAHLASILPLR